MKKTFTQIYNEITRVETPKMKFRREIAELTGKRDQTIKQWLSGIQFPSDEDIDKIASHLGVEPDGLFPLKHKQ